APLANWLTNVSTNADAVASGLSNAATTGSSAQVTMYQEDYRYTQDVDRIVGPEDVMSMGRASAIQRRQAQAAAVLDGEMDRWAAAYGAFQPGPIGPAPTRTRSGSAATGTGGGTARPALLSTPAAGGGGRTGSLVGGGGVGGDFPNSSVVGPNGG